MDFTPSSGQELQTEYFVPLRHGFAAIAALSELRDEMAPHLMISELRSVAADTLWMSRAYGRASMAIHFTWRPDWIAVERLLPLIEAKLDRFDARPHWAKMFTMDASRLRAVTPRMDDFTSMARELDPDGRLRNEFLDRTIYAV